MGHKEIKTSENMDQAEWKAKQKIERMETNPISNFPYASTTSNNRQSKDAWVAASPGFQRTQHDIDMTNPLRFQKDREFISFIPTKNKYEVLSKSNSPMRLRSRRSYLLPGNLDLSRFYHENNSEDDEEEKQEDYRSEIEKARERERFLRFMSLLAMKDSSSIDGVNSNANGLVNSMNGNYNTENDLQNMEEDSDPIIDLVHYDPYLTSSTRRQRPRDDVDRMSSNSGSNDNRNMESSFLSPGEVISLMSSNPGNDFLMNRGNNRQNYIQQKKQPSSQHSSFPINEYSRSLVVAANNLGNIEDNDGDWLEDPIPIHRHSLTRRSGENSSPSFGQRRESKFPMLHHEIFESPSQINNAAGVHQRIHQFQIPYMRNSESEMNSRLPNNDGGDGLYSLNQLLSGTQDIDPRVPLYQRVML